jgi:hypothetical protein
LQIVTTVIGLAIFSVKACSRTVIVLVAAGQYPELHHLAEVPPFVVELVIVLVAAGQYPELHHLTEVPPLCNGTCNNSHGGATRGRGAYPPLDRTTLPGYSPTADMSPSTNLQVLDW